MISDDLMGKAMDAVDRAGHEYLTWEAVRCAIDAATPHIRVQVIEDLMGDAVRFVSTQNLPPLRPTK